MVPHMEILNVFRVYALKVRGDDWVVGDEKRLASLVLDEVAQHSVCNRHL